MKNRVVKHASSPDNGPLSLSAALLYMGRSEELTIGMEFVEEELTVGVEFVEPDTALLGVPVETRLVNLATVVLTDPDATATAGAPAGTVVEPDAALPEVPVETRPVDLAAAVLTSSGAAETATAPAGAIAVLCWAAASVNVVVPTVVDVVAASATAAADDIETPVAVHCKHIVDVEVEVMRTVVTGMTVVTNAAWPLIVVVYDTVIDDVKSPLGSLS